MPDAIVDPWAVMVHFSDTPLANAAMVRAFGLVGVAALAHGDVLAVSQPQLSRRNVVQLKLP